MTQETNDNRRMLVVDGNLPIHEELHKILAPPKDADSFEVVRVVLFGEAQSLPTQVRYELDFASQGREALGLVRSA